MRPGWHIVEIDRITIFAVAEGTISRIVAKTVFDANDNPSALVSHECLRCSKNEIDHYSP
jgi:hypothetical protein